MGRGARPARERRGRVFPKPARLPNGEAYPPSVTKTLWRISTVTILLSILGSKALGFFAFLFQEAAKGGEDLKSAFTITEMVKNLGWVALAVIVILLIMSMYSIAIMVERFLTYSAAKKQSREFAPRVAQALKNDRIEE